MEKTIMDRLNNVFYVQTENGGREAIVLSRVSVCSVYDF